MKVLVACEFSGAVRDAFSARGHDAWSCDLLPSETPGQHLESDVLDIIGEEGWDLIIAHPPCTYLCCSGARYWGERMDEQQLAIEFVRALARLARNRLAIENPIGRLSTVWRKPDQIIQPWQFGHGYTKATCLWLRGLPPLRPTNIARGRLSFGRNFPNNPERWKRRSRTFPGIAQAMAEQWG
jgi:site-specific DNA-cytosine methylase